MIETRADRRLGVLLLLPVLAVILIASILPLLDTAWSSLHRQDLRLPWLGRPFVGLANYREALGDARFREAFVHTALFAAATVPLELALGTALALLMHHAARARGLVRLAVLLPWTVPTVVAALVWRFIFDQQAGVVTGALRAAALVPASFDWFVDPRLAWVPIAAADVWKTTPFVAILVLAGLQGVDPAILEAARIDGAGAARRLFTITLPLLRPTLVVAAAFRLLDALRLFDAPYVMTGGGPGTATESLSQYAFVVLMQRLQFGYGSALSLAIFLLTFGLALVWVRALSRSLAAER